MDARTTFSFPQGSQQSGSGIPPPHPERPSPQPQNVGGPSLPTVAEAPSSRGTMERPSASNLRAAFRPAVNLQGNTRAVTPEIPDFTADPSTHDISSRSALQSSPRTIPGSGPVARPQPGSLPGSLPARRQGVIFNDSFAAPPSAGSFDVAGASNRSALPFRPRTHTMDGAFRQQFRAASHGGGGLSAMDDLRLPSLLPPLHPPPLVESPVSYRSPADLTPTSASSSAPKDKKASGPRSRLTKKPSSRPSSPLSSLPPSVDSLPIPVPTSNANKVLHLMDNLEGRMHGDVEYQRDMNGPWLRGLCYIDFEKGSLVCDPGDQGPFHTTLVPDLRGCHLMVSTALDDVGYQQPLRHLEIMTPQLSQPLFLRPLVAEEHDQWLGALLGWQQMRPLGSLRPAGGTMRSPSSSASISATAQQQYPSLGGGAQSQVKRRTSSTGLRGDGGLAIIKVGKVMLWDKGVAATPRAIVKRPSTRDLRSGSPTGWRRVSCILNASGELRFMTDTHDAAVISVIELSQLARHAVQALDRSVLDEKYCLAIFPSYASSSTQLSLFRSVFVALDSPLQFEVWFVLLRAFTVPDLYVLEAAAPDVRIYEVKDLEEEPEGETFRLEKTVSVRVTEAKMLGRKGGRDGDKEYDPIGNYLAEVILDGEVRARTPTRMNTRNAFWREDCQFADLAASLPSLSVLVKRVEGSHVESFAHQLQATLGLQQRSGNVTEVVCGSVDVPLQQLERGRDHEQWLPIVDERKQNVGSLLVKVHHEEVAVLLSKHYQPLSDLLHRFDSGLTLQITEVMATNLRRVADLLLNIYQVSGTAHEWLVHLVEEEIDGIGNQAALRRQGVGGAARFGSRLRSNESIESSTSEREQTVRDISKALSVEANLLFRGNTLLTQALEFFLRRHGKAYLEETLGTKIAEINEANPNCEVDPSKLGDGGAGGREPDPQANWERLIGLTTEIWQCIASSATRLPLEVRHILKYIRAVAEDRYGDFMWTVRYTSVSGFLFLRFLCAAILNPKLFGLLRDHPQPRAQRTLTLIAKGLQALANLSTIGKKETWMEPMNRFLTAQRQPFRDFLDEVCAVPAPGSGPASASASAGSSGGNDGSGSGMTNPSYSTPLTIMNRLPPMAREGFPSLPFLIDKPRNLAALVKLWMDAHPAGEVKVYEAELLEFHKLCASLHQRSVECLARIESLRSVALAGNSTKPEDTEDVPGSFPGGDTPIALRQSSRTADQSPSVHQGGSGGTMRRIGNGIHPRKLLSGFRKTRGSSPDGTEQRGDPLPVRDKDREERPRGKEG